MCVCITTYLDQHFVDEVFGRGKVILALINWSDIQHVAQYVHHVVGHYVLLSNTAVILNGEDNRIPIVKII